MKHYQKYLFGGILIALFTSITATTVSGLRELFPALSSIFSVYFWIIMILVLVLCLAWWIRTSQEIPTWHKTLINRLGIIGLVEVLYSCFVLIADLWHWITGSPGIAINRCGCIISGLLLIAAIYGAIWGKYRYTITRETIEFADLPEAFDGITIVQISDIHAGSFDNASRVKDGIDIIKQQNADIFVFTGDLVNNTAHEFHQWKALFKDIIAPLGQFSILGNHDYGDYVGRSTPQEKAENIELLKQHHADLGRRLLLNEHLVIEKDGQQLVIAGVENRGDGFAQYGDLGKTLEGVREDLFTLMLSHDPSHWDKQIISHDKHVHLTLSGHTHAMQMGFHIGQRKRSPIKYRYKKRAGLYEQAGQYLYINKGFGFLGLSARIGMWPEITVLTLRKSGRAK